MLSAISSSHIALYQVSVRWARCLPLTSFRFHLAMDTLVSLAGRFPLPGLVRDLHPLDDTHAGQTEKSVPDKVSLSSADTKKKEQVARYLSVCYPLSHIKINSPYGYRKDPFTGKRKFHNGIDLHARSAKVFAMMQGRVIAVGQDKVSGKYVTLRHGGFTVSYCHLSQISVSQGQDVLSGDVVGITGNTGRSTGEHLHITCKYNGNSIDPFILISYVKRVRE